MTPLKAALVQGISIHAPRTGSDADVVARRKQRQKISIHAPRTGSDWDDINKAYSAYISIHAPRTGSDTLDG